MRRAFVIVAVALLAVAAVGAVWFQRSVSTLRSERVTDDVYVIFGSGAIPASNVGVLRTSAGAVIVDTMTLRMQGEAIRERAESIAGGPTQAIINTHYHLDHTHGNPGFAAGTRVVATQRTLDYLMAFDADSWTGDKAGTLPNDLFPDAHEMEIGGKTIRSLHLGAGHTGGDLVVLFVEDRVLHLGDLLFANFYPNIDLEAGGSIAAWIGTLDRALELEFDRVIPGHGPVTNRAGVRAYQDFLRELWRLGQQAAAEGLSLEETLATKRLTTDAGFGVIGIPLVMSLDRDFVLTRAWQEATGSVTAVAVPRAEVEEQ